MGSSTGAGSILAGDNPLKDPMALFLLQVIVIVGFSRIIAIPLAYLRQPKVIAEVIGGIILGKSALSRIPAFKDTIFPEDPKDNSLKKLQLVAEFGLILFLFLVGLEMDLKRLVSNARTSAAISLAGIILPFSVGVGASKALYDNLMEPSEQKSFMSFLIFTGVAMSVSLLYSTSPVSF